MLRVGSLTVDCDARVAQVDDRRVNLSRLEFDLLQTLATPAAQDVHPCGAHPTGVGV